MKKSNKSNKNILKISASMRRVIIYVSIILLLIGTFSVFRSFGTVETEKENKNIYKYTNNYIASYNINLTQNQYITKEDVPNNKQYVSDLISDIDLNLKYNYTPTKESEVSYNYTIDLIVKGSYAKDKENMDLINKVINLKKSDQITKKSSDVKIDEDVSVDFKKYHELIKAFKVELGMNIDSKLYVVLTVNTKTKIDGRDVFNQYKSDFNISLGEKVAIVDGKVNDSITGTLNELQENEVHTNIILHRMILGSILIIIGAITLYWIVFKTRVFYSVDNKFKMELGNLFKLCQDRVAIVENEPVEGIINSIKVSDIEELIKLSDELFEPILCMIMEEEEKAIFYILKDGIKYIYQYPSYKFND